MGSPWTAFTAPFPDRDDDETRQRTGHRRHGNRCQVLAREVGSIPPLWACGMAFLSKLEKTVAPMDADADASR
jgi:hypothetical protein